MATSNNPGLEVRTQDVLKGRLRFELGGKIIFPTEPLKRDIKAAIKKFDGEELFSQLLTVTMPKFRSSYDVPNFSPEVWCKIIKDTLTSTDWTDDRNLKFIQFIAPIYYFNGDDVYVGKVACHVCYTKIEK